MVLTLISIYYGGGGSGVWWLKLCRDGVDLTNFVRVWHRWRVLRHRELPQRGDVNYAGQTARSATQGSVGERSNVDAVVFAGGYDAFANGLILTPL